MVSRRSQIAALLLCAGFVLGGATLERLSIEDMAQKATGIARGRVLGSYAAPYGSRIYTHYKIGVSEWWKGGPTAFEDVVMPGGTAGSAQQVEPGTPALVQGGQYVLFLWRSRSGLTHVIGLSQGLFEVKRDGGGRLRATRKAATEPMFEPRTGLPVQDEDIDIKLIELRQRVAAALSARGQK